MHYNEERMEQYWQHYCNNKILWGHGVTLKRLEKVKSIIWKDGDFWDDILLRHSGFDKSPEEMKEYDIEVYNHCFGNFMTMVYQSLIEHKIIKL